jgi:hypothetical protein
MVCIPAYGGSVKNQFFMSCIRMQAELTKTGVDLQFGTISFPDIAEVRNIFTTIFFDNTNATHLLFIDADMSFEPKLILDMINFDQPIVGVVATKKKYPIEFVGRASSGDPLAPVEFDGFIKVDGAGTGILLIQRECIARMLHEMPDIIDPYPLDLHPASELIKAQGLKRLLRPFEPIVTKEIGRLSEDLSFSNRWLRCGGDIWANISHNIGHVGDHEFVGCYQKFLEMKRKEKGEAT